MTETASMLHNMSTPPKSVVAYAGLKSEAKSKRAARPNQNEFVDDGRGSFGTFITFKLKTTLAQYEPAAILRYLKTGDVGEPNKALLDLIESRANELPLPDACVVVPTNLTYQAPWPDPLAALAIITKSSKTVWLRHKSPRISALRSKVAVSLLVPPAFAKAIEGLKI